MKNLRIALAQINTTVGDLDGNAAKVLDFARRARAAGAHLVAFPEMALTGYPPEDLLLKEHFVANNIKALRRIARAVKGIAAVVGFVDRGQDGSLYNAAAIISDGKVQSVCRKAALPNYSVFDEKRYFTSGGPGAVFSCAGVRVGVTICEDIWVDGGPYLAQASNGAGLLINISSSPYETGKRVERFKLLRKRCRQTGTHIAYVNLVGGQDELVFDGASMVVAPSGKLVAAASQFSEQLLVCDIPGEGVKAPPLGEIEEIYGALVLGTRDYVRKNGFRRVVIGLSGGIDSALVAAIACDAVGCANVVGISMPTRFNAKATQADARTLAERLGIEFHEIPVEHVFQSYLETLAPCFQGQPFGLAEENLQARVRGNVLMAFSNKFGWLVLTTGNKSEMATGYCTLYGDMSGGYAVIKDILKTRVYELCAYVNRKAGSELIPASIFTRAPSAELRANQKDQDSLPPYPVLDELLVEYVEHHGAFQGMARRHGEALVRKVVALVDKSEYKRRQAPPGVKISRRAFGKDWRLPLTNHYKTC